MSLAKLKIGSVSRSMVDTKGDSKPGPGTSRALSSSNIKWEHAIAGLSGGVTSSFLLHPFDLVKTRMAVQTGRDSYKLTEMNYHQRKKYYYDYSGLLRAVRGIYKMEGIKGFYVAVVPNVVYSGYSWGAYFLIYSTLKSHQREGDSQRPLTLLENSKAAFETGAISLVINNPLSVVKTRLMLQSRNNPYNQFYEGILDGFKKIYQIEGIRGFYKGFAPAFIGTSQGAIQIIAYDEMKTVYNLYKKVPIDTKLTFVETLVFASVSKCTAAVITYPYQLLRTRLINQNTFYQGTIDCVRKTWRYESYRGFFKGLTPHLLHVTPSICIVMLIYEQVSALKFNS